MPSLLRLLCALTIVAAVTVAKPTQEKRDRVVHGRELNEEFDDVGDKHSYRAMLSRDERRFKLADRDGDLIASREEFTAFLHPEEFEHTREIVVTETIEDIDKNGDGFIDLDEYIGDMYTVEVGEAEPDWLKTEREQFRDFRDVNKDGKLDSGEVSKWILPGEVDHTETEAIHLIYESDQNKCCRKRAATQWDSPVSQGSDTERSAPLDLNNEQAVTLLGKTADGQKKNPKEK
ncbi:UNVERIFIED_CONTAM: hypothetical protein FKN15_024613 [Acipenser sinensis]